MNVCVVDSCVAVKWVVSETDSAAAIAFLNDSMATGRPLIRLDLVMVEATNVVWKNFRRNLLTSPQAHVAIADLRSVSMAIEPADPLLDDALALACRYDIAVYDALFVVVVRKYGCDGITSDVPLVKAVGHDFPSIKLLKDWPLAVPPTP